MTAQPGGMSADILRAHSIAAAKVRRQSLQIRCRTRYWPKRGLIELSSSASAAPPAKLEPNRRTRTKPSPFQAQTNPLWPRPRPTGFPLRATAKQKARPLHWDRPYVPRFFLHRGKGTEFPSPSIRRRHFGLRSNRRSTVPKGLPGATIPRYHETRTPRGRSPAQLCFHPWDGDAANLAAQKEELAKSMFSHCRLRLRVAWTSAPKHTNCRCLCAPRESRWCSMRERMPEVAARAPGAPCSN